jgi:hypothetical protein
MKTKGKTIAIRLSLENDAWLAEKMAGKSRGFISEVVNLAITDMRQSMEWTKKMKKKGGKV